MALRKKMIAVGSGLLGAAVIAMVIAAASQHARPRPSAFSSPASHRVKVHVTHGMVKAQSVSFAKAAREMPFPVLTPPTNRFRINSITVTKGPGAPSVQVLMGQLFHGPGLMILEQDHRAIVKGIGQKTAILAGYKATVAQWVNNVHEPLALAAIYTGKATYIVIGSHVPLSFVKSTLVTMLKH